MEEFFLPGPTGHTFADFGLSPDIHGPAPRATGDTPQPSQPSGGETRLAGNSSGETSPSETTPQPTSQSRPTETTPQPTPAGSATENGERGSGRPKKDRDSENGSPSDHSSTPAIVAPTEPTPTASNDTANGPRQTQQRARSSNNDGEPVPGPVAVRPAPTTGRSEESSGTGETPRPSTSDNARERSSSNHQPGDTTRAGTAEVPAPSTIPHSSESEPRGTITEGSRPREATPPHGSGNGAEIPRVVSPQSGSEERRPQSADPPRPAEQAPLPAVPITGPRRVEATPTVSTGNETVPIAPITSDTNSPRHGSIDRPSSGTTNGIDNSPTPDVLPPTTRPSAGNSEAPRAASASHPHDTASNSDDPASRLLPSVSIVNDGLNTRPTAPDRVAPVPPSLPRVEVTPGTSGANPGATNPAPSSENIGPQNGHSDIRPPASAQSLLQTGQGFWGGSGIPEVQPVRNELRAGEGTPTIGKIVERTISPAIVEPPVLNLPRVTPATSPTGTNGTTDTSPARAGLQLGTGSLNELRIPPIASPSAGPMPVVLPVHAGDGDTTRPAVGRPISPTVSAGSISVGDTATGTVLNRAPVAPAVEAMPTIVRPVHNDNSSGATVTGVRLVDFTSGILGGVQGPHDLVLPQATPVRPTPVGGDSGPAPGPRFDVGTVMGRLMNGSDHPITPVVPPVQSPSLGQSPEVRLPGRGNNDFALNVGTGALQGLPINIIPVEQTAAPTPVRLREPSPGTHPADTPAAQAAGFALGSSMGTALPTLFRGMPVPNTVDTLPVVHQTNQTGPGLGIPTPGRISTQGGLILDFVNNAGLRPGATLPELPQSPVPSLQPAERPRLHVLADSTTNTPNSASPLTTVGLGQISNVGRATADVASGLLRPATQTPSEAPLPFVRRTTGDTTDSLSPPGRLSNDVSNNPFRPTTSSGSPLDLSGIGRPSISAPSDSSPNRPAGSLNRQSNSSLLEVVSMNSAADLSKSVARASEIPSVASLLNGAKSATVGLDGKVVTPVDAIANLTAGKVADARVANINLQATQAFGNAISLTVSDAVKSLPTDVAPLTVRGLTVSNGINGSQIGQEVTNINAVKLQSPAFDGLKSFINLITGQNVGTGDKAASQTIKSVENLGVKVEIPNGTIRSGAFVSSTTFGTINGLGGSIKIEIGSTAKDGGLAISQVTNGKIDASTLVGTRVDAVTNTTLGPASLVQTINFTGKSTAVDVTNGAKTDATAGNATTAGLIITTGNNVNPQGQIVKGEPITTAIKVETGRTIEATKQTTTQSADAAAGSVRQGVLTPQMVAGIANAIRFGQPLPEGLTFQNGELAIKYGNEVLFFPGLKAALKFAEVVGLIDAEADAVKDDDQDQSQQPSWAAESRVQYAVKEGESVESIAAEQLGDGRYADLVVTINRSEILYRLVDGHKIPFVYPGQILWLPSERELKVYRKNFFGKNANVGFRNPLSAEVTAEDDVSSVKRAFHQEFIKASAPPQPGRPRTTVRDLPQLQPVVAQGELYNAMLHASGAPENVDLHAETIVRTNPNAQDAPVLLHASTDGADDVRDTVFVDKDEPEKQLERLLEVKRLANDARLLVTDYASNPDRFFVKLEMLADDNWTLVSAYEGNGATSVRVRYGKNGVKSSMVLHLPAHVIKAMATEDYTRNWSLYRTNFDNNKVSSGVNSGNIESAPPSPISFHNVCAVKSTAAQSA